MATYKTKLDQAGRVVVPAAYRKATGLHAGDEVLMRIVNGEIRLSPLSLSIRRAQDTLRQYLPKGRSLVDELIAERKEETKRG